MIFGNGGGGSSIGTGIVFSLYDQFSANAKNISNSFKNLEGVAEASSAKINASMQGMKLGFAAMAVGAVGLAAIAFPIKQAADFEHQMSAIKAVSGASSQEMKAFSDLSLEMGKKTRFSALMAAQGIEELVKAGVSTKDILGGGLEGTLSLAAAGEISVAEAATLASTTLNAFRDDALTVTQAADILAGAANASATDIQGINVGLQNVSAVAASAGLSFKDTATALALFAQNGMQASMAGTDFKMMLMELAPVHKRGISMMKQLGIITADGTNQFFDAHGKMKSLSEISKVLTKSLSGLTQEQRLQATSVMFGTSASTVANILMKEGVTGVKNMQDAMSKFTAADVAKERLNNFEGAVKQLGGSFETLMIVMGMPFMNILANIAHGLQFIVDTLTSVFSTTIGQVIMYIVAALSLLTFAIGAAVVAINLKKWAVGHLASALTALGKTELATIFINEGLIAGFEATAAALVPLLIELAPFIAAAAVIAALGYVVKKSWESFSEVADNNTKATKGWEGAMQRLGGVMQVTSEIWSSANMEGFSMSEKTANGLKSLGLFEFAKSLGTWLVRIKAFFSGVWDGMRTVFHYVKQAIVYVIDQINKLADAMGFDMSKNLSNIKEWAKWGKYLGIVLGGSLVVSLGLVALSFAIAAAAMLVFLSPFILIGYVVYRVVRYFSHWQEHLINFCITLSEFSQQVSAAFDYIEKVISDAILGAWQTIKGWWTWMEGLPSAFVNWGVSIVISIWDGIVSGWGWLKDKFLGLIGELPGGHYILDFFGAGQTQNVTPVSPASFDGGGQTQSVLSQATQATKNQNPYVTAPQQGTNTYHKEEVITTVNLLIDGNKLNTIMDKKATANAERH